MIPSVCIISTSSYPNCWMAVTVRGFFYEIKSNPSILVDCIPSLSSWTFVHPHTLLVFTCAPPPLFMNFISSINGRLILWTSCVYCFSVAIFIEFLFSLFRSNFYRVIMFVCLLYFFFLGLSISYFSCNLYTFVSFTSMCKEVYAVYDYYLRNRLLR